MLLHIFISSSALLVGCPGVLGVGAGCRRLVDYPPERSMLTVTCRCLQSLMIVVRGDWRGLSTYSEKLSHAVATWLPATLPGRSCPVRHAHRLPCKVKALGLGGLRLEGRLDPCVVC